MTHLEQLTESGFPDRGTTGIRANLLEGDAGAVLGQAFSTGDDVHALRMMVEPRGLTEGRVILMAASDDDGPLWWLELDGDLGVLSLIERGGGDLSWSWLRGPRWSCVEVQSVPEEDRLTLEVNGIEIGSLAGVSHGSLVAADLGVVWRDERARGFVDLDEWVASSERIGPLKIPASSDLASDPKRWAVLYRAADPDSIAFAEVYAQRHGVPLGNLIALDVPEGETFDLAGYDDLLDQVESYLYRQGLGEQVCGILVGYGVPGLVDLGGGLNRLPVASLLMSSAEDLSPVEHTLHLEEDDALRVQSLSGIRLSARMDGPSLAEALDLLDRADLVSAGSVGSSGDERLYVDTDGLLATSAPSLAQAHASFVESDLAKATRLDVVAGHASPDLGIDRVSEDGLVWIGLGGVYPGDLFGEPRGSRAWFVQAGANSAALASIREIVGGSSWARQAIEAGYAAVAGGVSSFTLSDSPGIAIAVDRLMRGWTLAESWAACLPRLRGPLELIGDPLMRIPLPKAGWDLRIGSGEAADGELLASGRGGQRVVDMNEVASGSGVARHVLVPMDAEGEPADVAWGMRFISDHQGHRDAGVSWVWPTRPGWPLHADDQFLSGCIIWPCSLREAGVASVSVLTETSTGQTRSKISYAPGDRRIDWLAEIPDARSRLCFEVSMDGGTIVTSPWSAWHQGRTQELKQPAVRG
ncbi:hypothetical protein [Mucisphaera sp.]|uniref:hypothetical protein n=1 Tax=Mucisphaera sp. TaxID=2913024 RepID=UPI003D14D1A4